jgi:hypothetical protein
VPDLLFIKEMSALLSEPSTVTSERKLLDETGCPERDLVWLMSAELAEASLVVSPIRTPMIPVSLPIAPVVSLALVSCTVVDCNNRIARQKAKSSRPSF